MYNIRKNAFAYTFGLFYSISEGFVKIRIQNVCGKANIICQIPISVVLHMYMLALSAPSA